MAASQYGIGPDYQIKGIDTVSGSVPPTVNLAEAHRGRFRPGQGVGQARSGWRWPLRRLRPGKRLCRN